MTVTGGMSGLSGMSGLVGGGFSLKRLASLLASNSDGSAPYYAPQAMNGLQVLTSREKSGTFRAPLMGRAYLFDGVDDYGVGSAFNFDLATNLTICLWFKAPSIAATSDLLGIGDSISTGIGIAIAGSKITYVGNGYSSGVGIGSALANNTWYSLAITKSGSTLTFYLNGTGIGTLTTSPASSANDVYLGAIFYASAIYHRNSQSIIDARVYSVVKSAAEIAAIYNQRLTPTTIDKTGLFAGWWGNEEAGTTGYDWSGNGNHLTLTNITPATFHVADTGVTWNPANQVGYTNNAGVIVPQNAATPTQDVLGGTLQYTGKSPYPAAVYSPCVTGDGSAVYVDFGSLVIPNSGDFTVEVDAWLPASSSTFAELLAQSESDGWASCFNIYLNSGVWSVCYGSYLGNYVAIPNLALAADNKIKIRKVGTTLYVSANGSTESSATCLANIYATRTTKLLGGDTGGSYSTGRVSNLKITVGTDTTTYPLQEGNGRDVSWYKSDGTYGTIAGAIVNGTVADIWANRTAVSQDWSVNNGGYQDGSTGPYIIGVPNSTLAANGLTKNLSSGKFGNPYSRVNFNPFTAAEMNGRSIPTAYQRGGAFNSVITPTNSAFRRTKADGDDRFAIASDTLTGADLAKVQKYVS